MMARSNIKFFKLIKNRTSNLTEVQVVSYEYRYLYIILNRINFHFVGGELSLADSYFVIALLKHSVWEYKYHLFIASALFINLTGR